MNAGDIEQCTASELAARLAATGSDTTTPLLLDVRENWERDIAAIEGSLNVVMNDVPDCLEDIRNAQGERELIVFCHTGKRSMVIARFLLGSGFERVANLEGGIDAWSQHINESRHLY